MGQKVISGDLNVTGAIKHNGTEISYTGSVQDVRVSGTSVVSGGVANIIANTAYNASSNKIATMADLPAGELNINFNDTTSAVLTTAALTNVTVVNDTRYTIVSTSETAASGGSTLSLVTTGEKYTWNNKVDVRPDGTNDLISNNKISTVYIPDIILGQLIYGGTATGTGVATLSTNAKTKLGTSSNSITLTNDTTAITGYEANEGIFYIISSTGTFAGLSLVTGDWLLSTGSGWTKIDNTDEVTSVNGQTGAVTIGSATSAAAGLIKLGSDTVATQATETVTATANRQYAVQVDSNGNASVNVPWTDTVSVLPACPTSTDGTYILQCVVSAGVATYSWVLKNTAGYATLEVLQPSE